MPEKFNEGQMNASRKVSDEELIEGGAETKEGRLQITDQQYEHLHKEMEVELVADPEAKGSVVDYIKDHIESDLSFQPQIRREVAKVLETLLKLSKTADKDFFVQPVVLFARLEENPRIVGLVERGFISLLECKKAAMNFEKLDDKQRKEIEEYIEGMIEKEVSLTLEQYMEDKLGLKAEKSYDPDTQSSDEGKFAMAALATTQAGNQEDFTLRLPRGQRKSDGEVDSIISTYYRDQGYEVKAGLGLRAKKGHEELLINVSNFEGMIMVSVLNMGRFHF